MATRVTRGAAAREAAFLSSPAKTNEPQQLSSPPSTPVPGTKGKASRKTASKQTSKLKKEVNDSTPATPVSARKRKRAAKQPDEDINELPHNLGRIASPVSARASEINAEPKKSHVKRARGAKATAEQDVNEDLPKTTPKKKGRDVKSPAVKEEKETPSPAKQSRMSRKSVTAKAQEALKDPSTIATAEKLFDETAAGVDSPTKKARKPKANAYGLTPGETPFPDWPHPTPEECQKVVDRLSAVHGEVKVPSTIPAPSTTVSGCGEVPSILDALIRTLLSAATTGTNSSRAFKGLVDTFGILHEGIGKGSVDWDKVRRADVREVFEAIKSGGLAQVKSKRIKEILYLVYEENCARRDALVKAEKEHDDTSAPRGAKNETSDEKAAEIARADAHILSLDHLHALSSDEALSTLIKYPGIGPKTASCVLLFCMRRPSFAVDTHVFRLCKWLGWVPPDKANRNNTYSHCEVRVPDGLKYALHQLLIKHGKTCGRCRAATGEGGQAWEGGCPIEGLMKRTGKRKGGAGVTRKSGKKGKKGADDDETEEDDDVDLTDESEGSDMA